MGDMEPGEFVEIEVCSTDPDLQRTFEALVTSEHPAVVSNAVAKMVRSALSVQRIEEGGLRFMVRKMDINL